MNPAQQETIQIVNAVPPVTATLQQHLVTASVNAMGTSVTVIATQSTGNDTLKLEDASGRSVEVPVRVAFNAGTIPTQLSLNVTGDPVDPQWLSQEVQTAVERATAVLPGAQATVASPPPVMLAPGGTANVAVAVQIAGSAYLDRSGVTNVTINQVPLVPAPAALLFYDDDPEDVADDGVLYRGTVTTSLPVRLYTYHENISTPRRIVVALSSDVTARVQTINAFAGPDIDVMSVGHAATLKYLTLAPHDEGEVLMLGAAGSQVLQDITEGNGELVAGVLDVRVLEGGPVTLTVMSVAPGEDPRLLLDDPPLPGDAHHRTGIFVLQGYGDDSATYTVGGSDAQIIYGDRSAPPSSTEPSPDDHDYGDYGVVRRINFTLTNPTDQESNAYLYERPLGGDVRSTFLVDGSLIQLGCVREPEAYQIAAYGLDPHQTYQVSIETMADGASNYPIEVGITATPPIPQTPPVGTPDGCFPKASEPDGVPTP